jgi:hypothetical protein
MKAKWLHLEPWGKDLSSILEQVPDCSEKYVSQTKIAQLRLNELGYREDALLIREEYITAIDMLEGPFQSYDAVVITGQPGIGVLRKPIFPTGTSPSEYDHYRKVMLSLLCFIASSMQWKAYGF